MKIEIDGRIVKLGMFTWDAGICLSYIFNHCDDFTLEAQPRPQPLRHILMCGDDEMPEDVKQAIMGKFQSGRRGEPDSVNLRIGDLIACSPANLAWLQCSTLSGLAAKVYRQIDGEVSFDLEPLLASLQEDVSQDHFKLLVEEILRWCAESYLERRLDPSRYGRDAKTWWCNAICKSLLTGEELPEELVGRRLDQIEKTAVEVLVADLDSKYYAGEDITPTMDRLNEILGLTEKEEVA